MEIEIGKTYHRRNPDNQRYMSFSIDPQADFFGRTSVLKSKGGAKITGKPKRHNFDSKEEALSFLLSELEIRKKRNYSVETECSHHLARAPLEST